MSHATKHTPLGVLTSDKGGRYVVGSVCVSVSVRVQ